MSLKPCPKCGCPDELELDSSRIAEASWIECHWCDHKMQAKCDEETLAERWNKLSRKQMPAFVNPYNANLPQYMRDRLTEAADALRDHEQEVGDAQS